MRAGRQPSGVSVENRLLTASLALAVLIFLLALVTLPGAFGYGVLWFAAVPLALTGVVYTLLRLSADGRHRWPRMAGIALCSMVVLAVVTSFIVISFALLPACALLIAACAQPDAPDASRTPALQQ